MEKQPINNHTYTTPEDAIAAAKKLGCDGYREYVVDGLKVYVPCENTDDFEKSQHYSTQQGSVVANGNETYGGNLVGLQFADNPVSGDPFFTLGNFSINTTLIVGNNEQPFVLPDVGGQNTAESLTKLGGDAAINRIDNVSTDKEITFNFDRTIFERFTLYGSLIDKIKFSIIDITEKYPAAIAISSGTINIPTMTEHSVDYVNGVSSFKINNGKLFNPFDIIYTTDGNNIDDVELPSTLRNFTKYYDKYDLIFDGVRYEILSYVGPESTNAGYLEFIIEGYPFAQLVTQNRTFNGLMYLVPKIIEYDNSMESLSDMGKYLLNTQINPNKFIAEFKTPLMDDGGEIIIKRQRVEFPKYDTYNIDLNSTAFGDYLETLSKIATDFDATKTNIVSRFLTTESLKEFDTDDRKIDIMLKSYGQTFDNLKKMIDALAFMSKVSYDSIENVPDLLLKNFARTLGWKTYEIEDEDTIAESLFNLTEDPTTEGDITPAELDIELWRRLLNNTAYLFKSKGTRKSVDSILQLVGIPELIYEINEYVYVATNKLDYEFLSKLLRDITFYPIDVDGYPTTPINQYFQEAGGSIIIDPQNVGPYDYGKKYIDAYEKFGDYYAFDIYRTVDNKKSWVNTDSPLYREDINVLNDTKYYINDSRLAINTKELEVFLSLDRIMDSRVYKLMYEQEMLIGDTSVSTLTFNSFLREVLDNFINVTNRKTIVTYPSLTKVYYDYITKSKELGLNYVNYEISMDFLHKYDSYWVKLIRQFTPATSILTAGKKIANSKLSDNKYQYLHGQGVKPVTGEIDDDLYWLGTDGSEFQKVTLQTVTDGENELIKNVGVIGNSMVGINNNITLTSYIGDRVGGYMNRAQYFDANYYNLYGFCNYREGVLEDTHGVKGTFENLDITSIYYDDIIINSTNIDNTTSIDSDITYTGIGSLKITTNTTTLAPIVPDGGSRLFGLSGITITTPGVYRTSLYVYVDKDMVNDQYNSYGLKLDVVDNGDSQLPGLTIIKSLANDHVTQSKVWIQLISEFTVTTPNTLIKLYLVGYDNYTINPLLSTVFYIDNIKVHEHSDGFDTAYDHIGVDYICPPPLPHVCFYDNTTTTIDEFKSGIPIGLNDNSVVTTYTSGATGNVPLVGSDLVVGGNLLTSGTTGNHTFIVPLIGSITTLAQSSVVFFEFEYENTYKAYFNTDDIINTQTNPILEIELLVSPVLIDGNGDITSKLNDPDTISSDIVSVELIPTFHDQVINSTSRTVRGYIIIKYHDNTQPGSQPLNRIQFNGNILIPELTDDFERNIQPTDGVGYVKIIRHKFHNVPTYSDNIISGTTLDNHVMEWFNNKFFIKQPKYYSLTTDLATDRPSNALFGSAGEWIVPYRESVESGSTTTTGEYAELDELVEASPLMHIPTVLDQPFIVTPVNDTLEINLSKSLNLNHVFTPKDGSGDGGLYDTYEVQYNATTANNQEIGGNTYMSDSVTINYDGMYPTKTTVEAGGPGPIYELNNKPSITSVIGGDVICESGVDNYIALATPNETFSTISDDMNIESNGPTEYYQPLDYKLFNFKCELIFDSEYTQEQDVTIKLVNNYGIVLASTNDTIAASSNANYQTTESRTISVDEKLLLSPTDQVFWVVEPHDVNCTLKEYDEVIIEPQKLYDGRTFINISPAQWTWSFFFKPIYDPTMGYNLPIMYLSTDVDSYTGGSLTGSVSGNEYHVDVENFTENFRYADEFYYDTIIFETIGPLYKHTLNGLTGAKTGSELGLTNKETYEYLPFTNKRVGNKSDYGIESGDDAYPNHELNVNSGVALINYSDALDIGKLGDYNSKNIGYQYSTYLAENPGIVRTDAVVDIINTGTINDDMDPLDYLQKITGPLGIDGIKPNTIHPYGVIDVDGLEISGSTYTTINTYDGRDGGTIPIVASLVSLSGLTSTYVGQVYLVTGETGYYQKEPNGAWVEIGVASTSNPELTGNLVELIFKENNTNVNINKNSPFLYYNKNLLTISGDTITISDDNIISEESTYLRSLFRVRDFDGKDYPRGLSNTFVKYRKKSHLWVYGSTVKQLDNNINQYTTTYRVNSDNEIEEKTNAITMSNVSAKHIDNNTLDDFEMVTNPIKQETNKVGDITFKNVGEDLIMTYKVEKNAGGYPKTGEFVGRLTFNDVCGNVATTLIRFFIINQKDIKPSTSSVLNNQGDETSTQ